MCECLVPARTHKQPFARDARGGGAASATAGGTSLEVRPVGAAPRVLLLASADSPWGHERHDGGHRGGVVPLNPEAQLQGPGVRQRGFPIAPLRAAATCCKLKPESGLLGTIGYGSKRVEERQRRSWGQHRRAHSCQTAGGHSNPRARPGVFRTVACAGCVLSSTIHAPDQHRQQEGVPEDTKTRAKHQCRKAARVSGREVGEPEAQDQGN